MSIHPIATRAKVSPDGKSYLFQVLDGLVAGLCLAADHGCSRPLVRCNSSVVVTLLCQIAACSCQWQGSSKIGNICHKCASFFVPCLSDYCFETLVLLTKKLLDQELDSLDFAWGAKEDE
ncbi:hypothetical protein MKW98_027341 [Papaver atlanticum]|uniref:Uncharacterized protein n=1 Tax=Papaver atlanticum TaxID=357466 RepID=A0AAD4SZG8_9MAGN|nr:hypothetical protein MKW98_027341 [Papaver atlanticum]